MDTQKVVLITGASSGIGKACATHLARLGYTVYGTSRRAESELRERPTDAGFYLIQMDVDYDESVARGVQMILEREGRIDVAVNSAGFGIAGAVEDTSIEEAKAQLETNFFGILRVCKQVLPIMRERRAGYIVNIGSMGGRIGLPYVALYHASKFAVEGLTESLRMEVKPFGIRVVLIEPGDFRTDFTARRVCTAESQRNLVYAKPFRNVLQTIASDEQGGSSPEMVARLLARIIENPSPRLRYMVGSTFQKVAVVLKGILPWWLFEWAFMRRYGAM